MLRRSLRCFCQQQQKRLAFHSNIGAFAIPKDGNKRTEDAFFLHPNALGIADGVGGWSTQGVDPSLYPRELMKNCLDTVKKHCTSTAASTVPPAPPPPEEANKCGKTASVNMPKAVEILQKGYSRTQTKKIIGSTTAIIVSLTDTHELSVANLGDSALFVLRKDEGLTSYYQVYRSTEQLYSFNFPYQIGAESEATPASAEVATIAVREGDVIMLMSDGVTDNVFDQKLLQLIPSKSTDAVHAEDCAALAHAIGTTAYKISTNPLAETPFAGGLSKFRRKYHIGGKVDDITILVAQLSYEPLQKTVQGLPFSTIEEYEEHEESSAPPPPTPTWLKQGSWADEKDTGGKVSPAYLK